MPRVPGRVQRLSLRYQVALGVAAGFVALFSLFGYLILNAIRQSTHGIEVERLKLAQTTAASVDTHLSHAVHHLAETFRLDAFSQATSLQQRADALERMARVAGIYDAVALLDADGTTLWRSPPSAREVGDGARHHAARALETESVVVGLVELEGTDHPPIVAVAAPYHDQAGRPMVALGFLHLSRPGVPLVPLPQGSPTFVAAVIDERGVILATTEGLATPGPNGNGAPRVDPHINVLLPLLRAGEAGVQVHDTQEEEHLVAFAPLQNLRGGVVVEERRDLALAVPNRLRQTLLLVGAVALVITSAGAWLHARYVTRPLEELERATRHIAAGALDQPVTVSRGDEIGMLARSFEAMRLQLQRAREERDRWEQQLEARVRERTEEVRRLLARTIHAQEEERRRLARELHDDTAQSVATLLVHMGTLRDTLPPGLKATREMLDRVLAQGRRALADVRRVIADLRPTALDDLGLIPALRAYAEERLAPAGTALEFQVTGEPRRLDPPVETALFRILQEAVSNVARHARARTARVHLEFAPAALVAVVQDDGQGFEVDGAGRPGPGTGVGLQGMRERAELLRARLEVTSRPGAGTRVRVEVPLEEQNGQSAGPAG